MNKKAAFLLIGGILLAIAVLSVVSIIFFGPEKEVAYISVTTEGFGERDVTEKLLTVEPGDTVAEIFSLEYKDYYEFFGKPLIKANEFVDFLGKKKEDGNKIRVYVNNELTLDIEQAYLGTNTSLKIVYGKQ